MDNIWNKRLRLVKALNESTNKYEKLSLRLQIADYDYKYARSFGNASGKKSARIKITALKRQLKEMSGSDELKAIKTLEKNLAKQIEYDKKLGYTFSEEERNGKKYLYKQKRKGSKKEHEYVAKGWDDLKGKQHNEAQLQVWGDHFALKDLAPVEIETFNMISKETIDIERLREQMKHIKTKKEKDQFAIDAYTIQLYEEHLKRDGYPIAEVKVIDPILSRASEQLGMRHTSNYRELKRKEEKSLKNAEKKIDKIRDEYTWPSIEMDKRVDAVLNRIYSKYYSQRAEYVQIKNLSIQEIKNILRATRKALIRRGNVDKKIEKMALMISEGNTDPGYIEQFIVSIIKDSKALTEPRIGRRKIGPIKVIEDYINHSILKNSKCMYAVLEPVEVRIFAENVIKKFVEIGGWVPGMRKPFPFDHHFNS